MSELILTEKATATTPAAGKGTVYLKPGGGLYIKDSTGAEAPLGTAGGGGGGGGSSAWADITDKPTTLTGYGITDAEPSITKTIGYAKWTGSAWSFSNETYMQTSHDANAVTAAAISNWDTAFGWGDHAAAGYTSNLGTVTSVAALTLGTTGTDVGSSVATGTTTPVITLNIPTASAINRGALSSTDWSTFNGKQAALGYTPANVSNNLSDLADVATARTSLGLGTLATQSGTFSGTSSGTNTGDQTSIVGITGTLAQFNTAVTDADLASLSGVESLTNKTITDIVFALTGTTPAFTATNGAVQTWTLTAASTPTNALTSGQSIILVITPGAFAVTWPSVVWTKQGGSGAAPTLFSAGKTSVVLWMVGAVLYGSHLGDTV